LQAINRQFTVQALVDHTLRFLITTVDQRGFVQALSEGCYKKSKRVIKR